jgi:hypothetical protein
LVSVTDSEKSWFSSGLDGIVDRVAVTGLNTSTYEEAVEKLAVSPPYTRMTVAGEAEMLPDAALLRATV